VILLVFIALRLDLLDDLLGVMGDFFGRLLEVIEELLENFLRKVIVLVVMVPIFLLILKFLAVFPIFKMPTGGF